MKTEAVLESFERGCKDLLKKYTHPQNVDPQANLALNNEMKSNQFGTSISSITKGFGGEVY